MDGTSGDYAYVTIPAVDEFRACAGLILAGMAVRARVGVGALEDAVDALERWQSDSAPTRFRFSLASDGVVVEVEEGDSDWRKVVELVS